MLRSAWTPGPDEEAVGPVLVSVTAFTADRARDLPGIFRSGLRLRRHWPSLEGAVGMWLGSVPRERRCGSVSVWLDERSLRGFVALPEHVAIMRRYRDRGRMASVTWEVEDGELRSVWARARAYLAGAEQSEGSEGNV